MNFNIKINTKLFTLDEVFSMFNHSEIYSHILSLKEIERELEMQIDILSICVEESQRVDDLVDKLNIQLDYLKQNIKTFGDALLCYETKTYEVRTIMGINTKIWLN